MALLDFDRIWFPYIYLYGVGGGIFMIGIYIILKSNSLKLDRVQHKKWLHILIFGLVYYMGIHAFFILAAIKQKIYVLLVGLLLIGLILNLITSMKTINNTKI